MHTSSKGQCGKNLWVTGLLNDFQKSQEGMST